MSERVKAGCVAAFLWVAALSLRAEDFPSVRDFGPYFEITGGDLVQTPRLMGPTGVVGWIHGREFVVHEVEFCFAAKRESRRARPQKASCVRVTSS